MISIRNVLRVNRMLNQCFERSPSPYSPVSCGPKANPETAQRSGTDDVQRVPERDAETRPNRNVGELPETPNQTPQRDGLLETTYDPFTWAD